VSEKPLHVRVAEAIGWTEVHDTGGSSMVAGEPNYWRGRPPGERLVIPRQAWPVVPRYDADWAATGPLIERFNLSLLRNTEDPPLIEVCRRILALKEEVAEADRKA
jgi:hypothetical protein